MNGRSVEAGLGTVYETKLFIERAVAIEHGTLHVIVGTIAWLAFGIAFRRRFSSWLPWAGLFALALFNEAVDFWVERWPHLGMQLGEGVRDIAITMLVPSMLMLAMHMRPDLFARDPRGPQ